MWDWGKEIGGFTFIGELMNCFSRIILVTIFVTILTTVTVRIKVSRFLNFLRARSRRLMSSYRIVQVFVSLKMCLCPSHKIF